MMLIVASDPTRTTSQSGAYGFGIKSALTTSTEGVRVDSSGIYDSEIGAQGNDIPEAFLRFYAGMKPSNRTTGQKKARAATEGVEGGTKC